MKRLFFVIALVATLSLLGTGATLAGGGTGIPGGTSRPVSITAPTLEPVNPRFIQASKAEILPGEYALFPGEPLVLMYEISNAAPIDYVVELTPYFQAHPREDVEWKFVALGDEDPTRFSVNAQGPVHLLVKGNYKVTVGLEIRWRRDIVVNPLPRTSIILDALRTNCIKVEGCPWG